jgi:hypothetical protein
MVPSASAPQCAFALYLQECCRTSLLNRNTVYHQPMLQTRRQPIPPVPTHLQYSHIRALHLPPRTVQVPAAPRHPPTLLSRPSPNGHTPRVFPTTATQRAQTIATPPMRSTEQRHLCRHHPPRCPSRSSKRAAISRLRTCFVAARTSTDDSPSRVQKRQLQ